ncbi:M23 family metallopeptidase [Parerythrobacter aurantius]|uniref:M23 family metallopeptidase n=1 Tax=Parerythrobacter aurantius TaxID=3127706 RepID=UPI003251CCE5
MIRPHLRAFAALLSGLLIAVPAAAQDEFLDDPIEDEAVVTPRVVISTSRAADIGRGGGPLVTIQSSRPRLPAIGGADDDPVVLGRPSGMPLAFASVTSRFGRRMNPVTGMWGNHRGIDLAAPYGTPVSATGDGIVVQAGWMGSYGILVVIRHGAGVETRYAHLSALAVRTGTKVSKGEIIGYVGSTGRSTGPHLHYEIRDRQQALDPERSLGQ